MKKLLLVVTLLGDEDGDDRLFGVFESKEKFNEALDALQVEINSEVPIQDFDFSEVELNKCVIL